MLGVAYHPGHDHKDSNPGHKQGEADGAWYKDPSEPPPLVECTMAALFNVCIHL